MFLSKVGVYTVRVKLFSIKGMTTVFCHTLLSRAMSHIKSVQPTLIRASNGFLVEQSINNAIKELKETVKLLEQAKHPQQNEKIQDIRFLK
jgi:hypothetical protein